MFRGVIVKIPFDKTIPIIPIYSLNPMTINCYFRTLKELIITFQKIND